MLRVLATHTDWTAISFLSTLVHHEDPLAACGLEEGATRDDDGLLWLAQFEIDIVRLTCADVLWAISPEDEVATELALTNLWIDLADLQLIQFIAT